MNFLKKLTQKYTYENILEIYFLYLSEIYIFYFTTSKLSSVTYSTEFLLTSNFWYFVEMHIRVQKI